MLAYHNDPAKKAAILSQLQAHHDADQFVKGIYWEGGKGCAVGCTIYSGDHAEYEPRFGIPRVLASLEDRLFEGLPNARAKHWPLQFMGAITPGADLSNIWPQFGAWILADETHGVIRFAKTPEQSAIIKEVAQALAQNSKNFDWDELRRRTWRIYNAAAYAADAAAYAAYAAAADAAADAAAAAAAYAAAGDALTRAASGGAAPQAAASAAPRPTFREARDAHYVIMADKMIELLQAAR